MDNLRELYQELILDYARKPHNFGALADATHHAHGYNPLCGDEITVHLKTRADGTIENITFQGQGCAISTAAASVMTDMVKNKPATEVEKIFQAFHSAVTGQGGEENLPTKLKVFAGVRDYPMRVKCATLPWHTLHAAMHNQNEATTE